MFKWTDAQNKAIDLITGDCPSILLYGGSRSGKTFLLTYTLVMRALYKKSRHAILRFRLAHIKQSIWYDSIPKVFSKMGLVDGRDYTKNKSELFVEFSNGSQIWLGGLDDKERVEKILGNEYSTIYENEASYIPYHSHLKATTRLAENSGLPLRMYIDCNPPMKSHWLYKTFISHVDPKTLAPLNPKNHISLLMNPVDNKENLPAGYIDNILASLPKEQRDRFLHGLWGESEEGTYYGQHIADLEDNGKVFDFKVPYGQKIKTVWDLGFGDSTAIWFYWIKDGQYFICDYYENHGKGLDHYVQTIRQKGYDYHEHFAPHDIMNGELGSGKTRLETARLLGINFRVVKKAPVDDGISAARMILPKCTFHLSNTQIGLENLRSYRKEWSDKMGEYKWVPLHDFTSHAADAFRYLALAENDMYTEQQTKHPYAFNNLLEHSINQRRAFYE